MSPGATKKGKEAEMRDIVPLGQLRERIDQINSSYAGLLTKLNDQISSNAKARVNDDIKIVSKESRKLGLLEGAM